MLVWAICLTEVEPESHEPVQGYVSEIEMSPRRATAVAKVLRGGAVCRCCEDELIFLGINGVLDGCQCGWLGLEVLTGTLREIESVGLVSLPTAKPTRARAPKARAEKRILKGLVETVWIV
jgi:hypothetical protein